MRAECVRNKAGSQQDAATADEVHIPAITCQRDNTAIHMQLECVHCPSQIDVFQKLHNADASHSQHSSRATPLRVRRTLSR
jgi:hypothetical protein